MGRGATAMTVRDQMSFIAFAVETSGHTAATANPRIMADRNYTMLVAT